MRWLLSGLLLALLGTVQALSTTGNRLLVVIDDVADKDLYSKFWADLESRGFSLSFETPKSSSLSLFKLGALAYDHLILLPSKSKGLGPKLTPNVLVEYVEKKGNILLSLSGNGATPSSIASTLLEFDITLAPERNSVVVDHFNYDKNTAAEKHDVLLYNSPGSVRGDVKDYFKTAGVLAIPRAVGQVLGNANHLATPILRGESTAYTYDPTESEAVDDVFASGSQLSLVTAFQARNSARLTVLGSAEMLQDQWFDAKVLGRMGGTQVPTSNKAFAEKLSQWTFQEIGVLKVGRLEHRLNEAIPEDMSAVDVAEIAGVNPAIYRIKNDVSYMIEISEWDVDSYKPYEPPASDEVQLEFSMLSPFHRLNLEQTSTTMNASVFTTSFKLPDQHGIFNFLVNYKRPFLTNVFEKRTVTVRHFAHDEWPRSYNISGALPWVTGIAVTVIGWLAFVALWLYSKPTESSTKKTQ